MTVKEPEKEEEKREEEEETEKKKKPRKTKKVKIRSLQDVSLSNLWHGCKLEDKKNSSIPPFRFRRRYKGVNYYPYSPYEQERNLCSIPSSEILNRFIPYDVNHCEITEEETKSLLELVHNLVDVNLCNVDDQHDLTHVQELYCLRLWQWIASLVIFPRDASTKIIIPCFVTGQGAGKGTLYNLIKLIIGCNTSPPISTSQYTSDFNSFLDCKTLVFLDELRMNQKPYDKLKIEVGDKKLAINEKFKPLVEIDNYVHYFIATNESQALKCMTEINQRRFLIINSPYDKYTVPDPSVAVKLNQIMEREKDTNGNDLEVFKNPQLAEKLKQVLYDHFVQIVENPAVLKERLPNLDESKFMEFKGDIDHEIVMKQNLIASRNDPYVACFLDVIQDADNNSFNISYKKQNLEFVSNGITITDTKNFWHRLHLGGMFLKAIEGYVPNSYEVRTLFRKTSFIKRLGLETETYGNGTIKTLRVPPKEKILKNLKLS